MQIQILPMTASYFPMFSADHIAAQTPDFAATFGLSAEETSKLVSANLQRALPDGENTRGNFFYEVHDPAGKSVGHLWLTDREFLGRQSLFISDIFVREEFRGHGIGKQLLAWVEKEARRRGLKEVTLHVFGANAGARRLYDASGFGPTSVHMAKRLY